jgi:hypothetical protein
MECEARYVDHVDYAGIEVKDDRILVIVDNFSALQIGSMCQTHCFRCIGVLDPAVNA